MKRNLGIWLLVAWLLQSCGGGATHSLGATETGNPDDDLGGTPAAERPSDPGVGNLSVAVLLTQNLCQSIVSCDSEATLTLRACRDGLERSTDLVTAVGLNPNRFHRWDSVIRASERGDLETYNQTAVGDCMARIANLNCADIDMNDLNAVAALLNDPTASASQRACENLFDLSPGAYQP